MPDVRLSLGTVAGKCVLKIEDSSIDPDYLTSTPAPNNSQGIGWINYWGGGTWGWLPTLMTDIKPATPRLVGQIDIPTGKNNVRDDNDGQGVYMWAGTSVTDKTYDIAIMLPWGKVRKSAAEVASGSSACIVGY